MMVTLLFLLPETGYTKPYKVDIYYPSGVGPFPVIILSHGAGGPSVGYNKKAEGRRLIVGSGTRSILELSKIMAENIPS